jgi:hypothetical protein
MSKEAWGDLLAVTCFWGAVVTIVALMRLVTV